tara:strand:- start:2586 stop:2807 length:222 start_codon:yes stop_codon:yes gene_type:complete
MATVTTYKSPDDLATALGLVVVSGLDESGVQANYIAGDLVLTSGGNYTIVKSVIPATTQIVQKGIFYTVIDSL